MAVLFLVGDELLRGQVADKHLFWLSEKLGHYGIHFTETRILPDDESKLIRELQNAEAELIITVGGLGPTDDDVTRSAVSACAGVPLIRSKSVVEWLTERFTRDGRSMPESNLRQADYPEGFQLLDNSCGTAPGFWGMKGETFIVSLPGPPRELHAMFENGVEPLLGEWFPLARKSDDELFTAVFVSESGLQDSFRKLRPLQTELHTVAGDGIIRLRLTGDGDEKKKIGAALCAEYGADRFFSGHVDPFYRLITTLQGLNTTIALAESCTGGGLASRLTDIPGSSSVVWGGWVVYSNESKVTQLGVSPGTIETHGSVSSQTAREMVLGALKNSGAGCAVAITGIAGPGGGTPGKPVGLVYIAAGSSEDTLVVECHNMYGDRQGVRNRSCLAAVMLVNRIVTNGR